ncbi:two component system sensor histidine kinase, hybrid [Desulfosarcina variabilis str. Montpellier]|uniref:response regulator n=1 Tax=Desulfosarcina variabilis TaxID=2300 RepID=UPI003AFAD74E
MKEDHHPDRRKILIVDDNPDIHRDFANILNPPAESNLLDHLESEILGHSKKPKSVTAYHYALSYATQGEQALEMVTAATGCADPFLLAFVDMRMPPGWDGLETIERLWQVDPQLQMVLCTAYSDYSWQDIQQHLGQTANLLILKKPFDVSEVAQLAATLTEKWRLSKKAATKQATLSFMVEQRTQELQAANQQLKHEIEERKQLEKQLLRAQKMEAIGTLAAGVAHDLNNILSGIVSYPDLLLMQVDQRNPMHHQLKVIQQSGEKAAAIVQDMLTLGRRGVTNYSSLDLKTVIEEYLQSPGFMTLKRHYANVRVETQICVDAGWIQGSDSQLGNCLMNLVANAAEAIYGGGIVTIELAGTVMTEDHEGYVSIPSGNYMVMSVVDTGEGIPEEDLEHIFEPFYTKKKMGRSGTGLGLAVVWGVVRDHRGFIDVVTQANQGTRFDLYFPAIKKSVMDPQASEPADKKKELKKWILVVDDVAEQREVGVALLQALGYRAEAVASGEAALEMIKNQPIDLLLLDMVMDPGIDGLETYQRALKIDPQLKAIIASGYTKSERVEKALALGASGFLRKPYRLGDLAKALSTALKAPSDE